MKALTNLVTDNPILVRELRRRMRGKALLASIISYIFLMTGSAILVLMILSPSPFAKTDTAMLQALRATGENLFFWVTAIQGLLVLLIAPTITAGLTTGEKERQTFDFLRVTTISRWMYVMGCFLSTLLYVSIALLCAMPLLAVTLNYGGVSLPEIVQSFVYLFALSCTLSAYGLFISSVVERTRTAQGIIVLTIFGFFIAGIVFATYYYSTFIAAGASIDEETTANLVFLFGFGLPGWVFGAAAMLATAAFFLLLAARKLFEPDDVRAFAHWQFTVVLGIVIALGLGYLSSNTGTNELPEVAFLSAVLTMVLSSAFIFAVGRMELGDEIWHLKRLFPILRPLDQTLPFLALIGAAWYLTASSLPSMLPTTFVAADFYATAPLYGLSVFVFLVAIARAGTALTDSRRKTFRSLIGVVTLLFIILPLSFSFIAWLFTGLDAVSTLRAISPIAYFGAAVFTPGELPALSPMAKIFTMGYFTLAAVIGIAGEIRRFIKFRHYNYHYDMPAGA